jgi:cobalt transporter subunit CbtB
VEGAWGIKMQTEATKPTTTVAALALPRVVPIFFAALLGAFIVGGVGFSHIAAVHNAAHDYRHSMSFPCH